MNKILASKLLEKELEKRKAPLPDVLGECFPQQLNFIKDSAKRKIACLTRRSGKSTSVGLYLINEALKNPRSKSVYVNLTKDIAKKVMWTDIFETVILKLKIPADLVGLDIKFKNGSIISLTGADATYKEKQKLRGQKNILAVIDECQSFTQDLEELIISVILPTLADNDGTLCLIGTPGDQMGSHYWWKLNDPEKAIYNKAWNYFHWGWRDNPHVRDNMQKQVSELINANPLIQNTTKFRQEYLGEWVVDASSRIYQSTEKLNYVDSLPDGLFLNNIVNLSIDLGFVDATAFVLSTYNRNLDNNWYVLESKKSSGLTITAVANKIKEYQSKYKIQTIVIDAANLQAVEEMRMIHALPLHKADKAGKFAHIALMNSDFVTGNIKIFRPMNTELILELESLIYDQRALQMGKQKEDARKDNHLTDALLYGHHASRHYWYQTPIKVDPNNEIEIKRQLYEYHIKALQNKSNSLEVNYDE